MPPVPILNENGQRVAFVIRAESGFLFLPPSGKTEWRRTLAEGTMFNSETAAEHHALRIGLFDFSLLTRDWPDSKTDLRVSKYRAN